MEVFLISGSDTDSVRTATSLLMAFGLRLLRLHTLHIQVTASDEQPVLEGEMPAPFATAWFPANERPSCAAAIRNCIDQFPEGEAVVVDLAVSAFDRTWIADPAFRILLPMSTGPAEVERAVRDFHAIADAFVPSGLVLPWLLPVGWPSAMHRSDYEPMLDRAISRLQLPALPGDRVIQQSGFSRFDFKSAPPILDGRILLSPGLASATEGIAHAILKATGSSLLESPGDAS